MNTNKRGFYVEIRNHTLHIPIIHSYVTVNEHLTNEYLLENLQNYL